MIVLINHFTGLALLLIAATGAGISQADAFPIVATPKLNLMPIATTVSKSSFASFQFPPSPHIGQQHTSLATANNDNDFDNKLVDAVGAVSQPIVWVSLYSVATTGGGLPSGPFGLLGALEGVSYLAVVGLALFGSSTIRTVSRVTILLGLLTLASLVAEQGCVPNAKPILDYSEYLPVCDPEQTPGLFGVQ